MKDIAKLALTVSAIALLASVPAFASDMNENSVQQERTSGQADTPKVTKEDAKRGWENTKEKVSDKAEEISNATKEKYREIKASLIDKSDGTKFSTIVIDPRMTADGMINSMVYNGNGERVAKVHDIILDDQGKAIMIVVSDGEFIGLGKKAAFDYSAITRVNADGDVIMPLTEEMINNAVEFSYDKKDEGGKVRVIPNNGFSAAKLLDGKLVDQNKKTVAQIDNISFRSGKANQLIVGFDKILGMGGEKAALAYNDVKMIPDGDGYDYQLDATQAAHFEAFKKSVMTN